MSKGILMVQGATSDAGKSFLVAALCRALSRRGVRVAPFKPQNMALNSAVSVDGGEIGRAQAVQAMACGIAPHSDMNPVLLKPSSDRRAQVIIQGKVCTELDAVGYHQYKKIAQAAVLQSFQRLRSQYDVVIVEGAGSPAEINLREGDIANMGFAEAVDCPVLLIADIDRGGVFAHLYGTLALLSETEQSRVVGLVINKFRGDIDLLTPGVDWLESTTGKRCLGVLPYLQGVHLDAEDALVPVSVQKHGELLKVLVPVFPRISNHTDFDALRLHPHVDLQFLGPGQRWSGADLVILPGSKHVAADLAWFKSQGWDKQLAHHLRYGGKVLGICGGFQMLGQSIADPLGVESAPGTVTEGLGYLNVHTIMASQKTLRQVQGHLTWGAAPVVGYEIHMGQSEGSDAARPFVTTHDGRKEGAISEDGQIMGTYLHGLFDTSAATDALLSWGGLQYGHGVDLAKIQQEGFNAIADCIEAHLDMPAILKILHL